MAPREGVCSNR